MSSDFPPRGAGNSDSPVSTVPRRPNPEELPTYQRTIRLLSDRIVAAQRPIRILDACKWEEAVGREFLANGGQELPKVDQASYTNRPLGFDLADKENELYAIERDIRRELGTLNPTGQLMLDTCEEYRTVLELLANRGKPAFSLISQRLFGSTFDRFHADQPTLGDLSRTMHDILGRLGGRLGREQALADDEKSFDCDAAVEWLGSRMDQYFGAGVVKVKPSDGVVADAAAGADYIKLRQNARFSARELGVLEVHEGWVHIGTTLNGSSQPVATFLGKGTPACTITQEGLAIIQEIFSFRSSPARIRRLDNRIEAIRLAEEGADFLEVYRQLLDRCDGVPELAYQTTARAFRGSLPSGVGPFTKDLAYSRGFILIYNFVRLAVRSGQAARIPLLFLGKLRLANLGTLALMVEDGVVIPPLYLPPPYRDLAGLAAWMCYSNFLNTISLDKVADDYAALLGDS